MFEATMMATIISEWNVLFFQQIIFIFIRYGIISIIFLFLLFRLIKSIHQWFQSKSMIDKFPGIDVPLFRILLGNLNILFIENWTKETIINDYFQLINGMTKIFDSTTRIWLSIAPTMLVSRADIAEKILSNNNVFLDKDKFYDMLKPWLNEGLLTSASNKWRARRKMLTPAFHFNILEQFLPIMNEQANILSQVIQDRQKMADDNYIDVVPLITNATLDVISETAMGVKIGSQLGKSSDYVDAVTRVSATIVKRILLPWLQYNKIYFNLFAEGRKHRQDINLVHQFTMNVIKQRKSEILKRKEQNHDSNINEYGRRLAFMDLLIEQHMKDPIHFTELDIREEVDTFMFEGHDTTAMSLIWTLHLLGNHPDIQNRVHKEIDEIRQHSNNNNDNQTMFNWSQNELRQMKFLEACIKESLRIYPSVPVIMRFTHQDTEIEPNRIIPKGTTVALILYMIQRDPKYFQQPERFIPDRFIEGSEHYCGHMNPFAFVPFSAGSRNCIGQKFALQEEKIMLATLLSKYLVESGDNLGNIPVNAALILRPKSSVNIRFIRRTFD
ncbi:cytochrome P450 4c3-like [Dermatophagoides pteronyssinus]|uniref:cytochrome P450 4c3-like n=1 Tax=Dermatophagoides pteronyssinus TaxID=6956 RepID=UPI003F67C43A